MKKIKLFFLTCVLPPVFTMIAQGCGPVSSDVKEVPKEVDVEYAHVKIVNNWNDRIIAVDLTHAAAILLLYDREDIMPGSSRIYDVDFSKVEAFVEPSNKDECYIEYGFSLAAMGLRDYDNYSVTIAKNKTTTITLESDRNLIIGSPQ